jgi:hypothetical protein
VILRKKRYTAEGIGGVKDRPKPGKPRTTDDVAIVLARLEPPPKWLGVTHWSSRLLAAELGVSNVKVADVWRELGLQAWRAESFKFSTGPQLEAEVCDLIGLYLNPPDKAVVQCVDDKPQTQAVERKVPVLTMRPGVPGKRSHDYVRHGTTALFVARKAATGKVTGTCYPRHRHQEFLTFLRQVAKAYPRMPLDLVWWRSLGPSCWTCPAAPGVLRGADRRRPLTSAARSTWRRHRTRRYARAAETRDCNTHIHTESTRTTHRATGRPL